jgi:hypothetical protein
MRREESGAARRVSRANYKSGKERRRSADGRKKRDVTFVLRLRTRFGLNSAACWERNIGRRRLRENATRQVLEHLALEAIVIGRMRRTARDI